MKTNRYCQAWLCVLYCNRLSILQRGKTYPFFEGFGKALKGTKPNRVGNFLYGMLSLLEIFLCAVDADFCQIVVGRFARTLYK